MSTATDSPGTPPRKTQQRAEKLQRYIRGNLSSHISSEVAVVLSDSVETAAVCPTSFDTNTEYDGLDEEEIERLAQGISADYLVIISSRPAPSGWENTALSEEEANKQYQFALALHETLHILKTSLVGVGDLLQSEVDDDFTDFVGGLQNVVEDGAIETELRTSIEWSAHAANRIEFARQLTSGTIDEVEKRELTLAEAIEIVLYDELIWNTGISEALLNPADSRVEFAHESAESTFWALEDTVYELAANISALRSDHPNRLYENDKEISIQRLKCVLKFWKDYLEPHLDTQDSDSKAQDNQSGPRVSGDSTQQEGGQGSDDSGMSGSSGKTSQDSPDTDGTQTGAHQQDAGGEESDEGGEEATQQEPPATADVDEDDDSLSIDAEDLTSDQDLGLGQSIDDYPEVEFPDEPDPNDVDLPDDVEPEASIQPEQNQPDRTPDSAENASSGDSSDSIDSPANSEEDGLESEPTEGSQQAQGSTSGQNAGAESGSTPGEDTAGADKADSAQSGNTSEGAKEKGASPELARPDGQFTIDAFAGETDSQSDASATDEADVDESSEGESSSAGEEAEQTSSGEASDGLNDERTESSDERAEDTVGSSGNPDQEGSTSSPETGEGEQEPTVASNGGSGETAQDQRANSPESPEPPEIQTDEKEFSPSDFEPDTSGSGRDGGRSEMSSQESQDSDSSAAPFSDIIDEHTPFSSTEAEREHRKRQSGAGDADLDSLKTPGMELYGEKHPDWEDVVDNKERVATTLASELSIDQQSGVRRGLSSGRYDSKLGYRLAYGDTRVFSAPVSGDNKKYHIVIILDRSGSMNDAGKIEAATEAVALFSKAAESLGIKVSIIDFYEAEARYVKPAMVPTEVAQNPLLSKQARFGTPLSDALSLARSVVQIQTEEPIIVAITDDKPSTVSDVADEISASTAPVCSLTLAFDRSEGNLYEKAEQLEDEYVRTTTVYNKSELIDALDRFAALLTGF